jgi:hypothetical protein
MSVANNSWTTDFVQKHPRDFLDSNPPALPSLCVRPFEDGWHQFWWEQFWSEAIGAGMKFVLEHNDLTNAASRRLQWNGGSFEALMTLMRVSRDKIHFSRHLYGAILPIIEVGDNRDEYYKLIARVDRYRSCNRLSTLVNHIATNNRNARAGALPNLALLLPVVIECSDPTHETRLVDLHAQQRVGPNELNQYANYTVTGFTSKGGNEGYTSIGDGRWSSSTGSVIESKESANIPVGFILLRKQLHS